MLQRMTYIIIHIACLRVLLLTVYYESIDSKLRIFLLFYSHAWKYNIQANESLTKVKEK